jgi:hypothetical protein
MPPTLEEVRARTARHDAELDRNTKFFSVADLAKRWGVSVSTVRAIPRERLPWTNLGHGLVRELRRYHPDAVASYEGSRLEEAG